MLVRLNRNTTSIEGAHRRQVLALIEQVLVAVIIDVVDFLFDKDFVACSSGCLRLRTFFIN
jgi:hypothetical protein